MIFMPNCGREMSDFRSKKNICIVFIFFVFKLYLTLLRKDTKSGNDNPNL